MNRISMEQATDIAAEEPLVLGHPSSVASRLSKERIALAQDLIDARARIAALEAENAKLREKVGIIARWPIAHPDNQDAHNMQIVAAAALKEDV